ncbi:hypothetical protein BDZ94DRAFT_1241245 [Collybia nuda]|uniref:Uncharacterized protein n=1 Tax=Collybia nuda TaxID=64659 RepID=A0A9P6C975_9AGAR|nr:hypothetical protein BDZ94DRAFT_1241245 [Collybia nuda]
MEFLAVVTTVYALAKSIHTWVEEYEEKHATIRQISGIISQIQHILMPLQDDRDPIEIEPQTLGAIRSIGGALKKTQEHLVVWKHRRSSRIFAAFSPSSVIKQLKEDERQLSQQLILLLTSIAVVGFVQKQRKRRSLIPRSIGSWEKQESVVLASIGNFEVKQFWRAYVGAELAYISGDEFCDRLAIAMDEKFEVSMRKRLLLRLDEFAIGGVTPAALEDLVGMGNLRGLVNMFSADSSPTPAYPSQTQKWWSLKAKSSRIALPLLVWIDDNPESVVEGIREAQGMGINVIHLTSTALAKDWIEANGDFLRLNDDPSRIRFISDNHRDEPNSGPYLNISAGENILRYLRGRRYNFPVLIFCGYSIMQTTYVNDYHLAGSANSYYVTEQYFTALSQGRSDDTQWVMFNAGGW